jgi:cytochrome c oxidase assembly protein Cox11
MLQKLVSLVCCGMNYASVTVNETLCEALSSSSVVTSFFTYLFSFIYASVKLGDALCGGVGCLIYIL